MVASCHQLSADVRENVVELALSGGRTATMKLNVLDGGSVWTDPDNNMTWTCRHTYQVATEVNPLGFATTYGQESSMAALRQESSAKEDGGDQVFAGDLPDCGCLVLALCKDEMAVG